MSTASDRHDRLAAELERHDLLSWLDLSVVEMAEGRVVFELPFDEKFANIASGTVHGGITATVIDTASGFALRTTFETPSEAMLTTTDLNTRYVRPATSDLRVEAEVVRAGRTMGVTECEVTSVHEGERKVVATGGTTYRLFRQTDGDEHPTGPEATADGGTTTEGGR